jgi:amino acid transporter
MGAGVGYVDPKRFAPSDWGSPLTFVAAGFVIFVAYEGFELIANSAADVKDPSKTLPRAYNGSVLLVIGLYLLVALVTVGTVPEAQIAVVKDYALAEAAKPALGQVGFTVVAVSALLATFSAINASLYGNARLGFTLAVDGELPPVLERKVWNQPVSGVLVVAGLSLLMANLIDLTSIAIIGSAGFLLIFAAANAAGVKLAKETGGNRWISLAGCLACLASLVTLLIHTARDNINALWVFLAFIVFSAGFELTYGRLRRGPIRINGKSNHGS